MDAHRQQQLDSGTLRERRQLGRETQLLLALERRYGSFRREVSLPTAVDGQNVNAEYKDGVLSITLKKAEEALPRKIQVQAK